jgi:hypothetical protein
MREGVMARLSEAAGFAVPKERPKFMKRTILALGAIIKTFMELVGLTAVHTAADWNHPLENCLRFARMVTNLFCGLRYHRF